MTVVAAVTAISLAGSSIVALSASAAGTAQWPSFSTAPVALPYVDDAASSVLVSSSAGSAPVIHVPAAPRVDADWSLLADVSDTDPSDNGKPAGKPVFENTEATAKRQSASPAAPMPMQSVSGSGGDANANAATLDANKPVAAAPQIVPDTVPAAGGSTAAAAADVSAPVATAPVAASPVSTSPVSTSNEPAPQPVAVAPTPPEAPASVPANATENAAAQAAAAQAPAPQAAQSATVPAAVNAETAQPAVAPAATAAAPPAAPAASPVAAAPVAAQPEPAAAPASATPATAQGKDAAPAVTADTKLDTKLDINSAAKADAQPDSKADSTQAQPPVAAPQQAAQQPDAGNARQATRATFPGSKGNSGKASSALLKRPIEPDYYQKRAKEMLKADGAEENDDGLDQAYPDHTIVSCIAGCGPDKAKVVYMNLRKDLVIESSGEVVPTAAGSDSAVPQPAASSIMCVAGCYDQPRKTYKSPTRVEIESSLKRSAATQSTRRPLRGAALAPVRTVKAADTDASSDAAQADTQANARPKRERSGAWFTRINSGRKVMQSE